MKKVLLLACAMMLSAAAYAQGTLNFNNRFTASTPPVDAPIFDTDGTKLDGAEAFAQLYAGPTANSLTASAAAPVNFRTGAPAGYVDVAAGAERSFTTVAPGGSGFAQVRAWKGAATWEAASIRGESNIIPVSFGGGSPPLPAGDLIGLASFTLVPEPSTIALGLLGAAALVAARRRK